MEAGGFLQWGCHGTFFECFFEHRFKHNFYRFFLDFAGVLGGLGGPKIVFLCVFWRLFSKLHFGKLFFKIFTVFSTLESLKIVLPSRRELNFYKIVFLVPDKKRKGNLVEKL